MEDKIYILEREKIKGDQVNLIKVDYKRHKRWIQPEIKSKFNKIRIKCRQNEILEIRTYKFLYNQ